MARLWAVTFLDQGLWSLRRSLVARRSLLVGAALLLLLAMQAIILGHRRAPNLMDEIFAGFHCWASLSVVLPLAAMFLGATALLEDLERGSFAYLVSRPAPRTAIYLGRTAGAGAAAVIYAVMLIGSSYALFRTAGRLDPGRAGLSEVQLPAFLSAGVGDALCFAVLGAALGAITRRGLLLGLALVLGGELLAGSLLAQAEVTGLRSILATDLSRQVALIQLPAELQGRLANHLPPLSGAGLGELVRDLGRYLLLCLAVGVAVFALREHPYRAR